MDLRGANLAGAALGRFTYLGPAAARVPALAPGLPAVAELENFGAYGKAPAPAEEEAPPPKRQRAPARSSASLLAEAEAELASSQVE